MVRKGIPDTIACAHPEAQIQICILHMMGDSIKFVPWKDYKAVTADLKQIYQVCYLRRSIDGT